VQPGILPILQLILDATREAVVIVDRSMRVAAANAAAVSAFSRDRSPLENRRLSELVRDPLLHNAFIAAIERGVTSDLRIEFGIGERRIYDVRVTPFDLEDRAGKAIGFFYDVTQVERLEQVRQEFLSNISHELRTPLTSIIAFVETLEDGAIDDQDNNRRFISIIRRNAERVHALISEILELSLIESGRISIDTARVDLHRLVDDVFTALSSQANDRAVRLINNVPEYATVIADVQRLEQMLTNLIDNAVKFNRQNKSVTVTHRCEGDSDFISVVDEGEGIPPDQLARIFERFYRADRARTSGVGGTGLGLSIVKHLAKLHDGEISADSRLGEGTVFTIELPAEQALKSRD
ncbi:MAG: PAS domain-containing protein, partial [Acidobacteria bacterium]|nr:PAS domain-containing protein [Acidobacteriota bacterium]